MSSAAATLERRDLLVADVVVDRERLGGRERADQAGDVVALDQLLHLGARDRGRARRVAGEQLHRPPGEHVVALFQIEREPLLHLQAARGERAGLHGEKSDAHRAGLRARDPGHAQRSRVRTRQGPSARFCDAVPCDVLPVDFTCGRLAVVIVAVCRVARRRARSSFAPARLSSQSGDDPGNRILAPTVEMIAVFHDAHIAPPTGARGEFLRRIDVGRFLVAADVEHRAGDPRRQRQHVGKLRRSSRDSFPP